jgi:hypothetical protein
MTLTRQIGAIAALAGLLAGCSHKPAEHESVQLFKVSFPEVALAKDEYIQSVQVQIESGRVAAVNVLPEDWDVELVWDTPSLLNVKYTARHFSSGLETAHALDGFITLQPQPAREFDAKAKLTTASPDPTGRAPREISFCKTNLVFQGVGRVPNAALPDWLVSYPAPPTNRFAGPSGDYMVRSGDTIVAIAAEFYIEPSELIALNPGIRPTALKIGQKIKIRSVKETAK